MRVSTKLGYGYSVVPITATAKAGVSGTIRRSDRLQDRRLEDLDDFRDERASALIMPDPANV
jgi:hypothetical protein